MNKSLVAVILFFRLYASIFSAETNTPVPYGPAEFPEWQKDLRRAEILSFGSLPFVTFFSSIYYDVYRYFSHEGQEGYLPWPMKNAESAIPLTEDEQKTIFFSAIGISIGVAIVDFSWRAIRRSKDNRTIEKKKRNEISPITIVPLSDSTDELILQDNL